MRRDIGAVAQTMLKNEIRTSENHSKTMGSTDSKRKAEKKKRYEGKKQFNLILPENLYQEAKKAAAQEERSMNNFIVFAVKQALKKQME